MTEQTTTIDQTSSSGDGTPELSGVDLARVALQQARLAAKNNAGEARPAPAPGDDREERRAGAFRVRRRAPGPDGRPGLGTPGRRRQRPSPVVRHRRSRRPAAPPPRHGCRLSPGDRAAGPAPRLSGLRHPAPADHRADRRYGEQHGRHGRGPHGAGSAPGCCARAPGRVRGPGRRAGRCAGAGEDSRDGFAGLSPGARRAPGRLAPGPRRPVDRGSCGAADEGHAGTVPPRVPRAGRRPGRRAGLDRGHPGTAAPPGRGHRGGRTAPGPGRARCPEGADRGRSGDAELVPIVLHHTVWVTTSDGHLHPAPCTPSEHLWWGNGYGDRPSEAATVINALLDDLGATPNLREHWNAPKGLTALLNEDHKQGTELTRSTLLHARMTPPRAR